MIRRLVYLGVLASLAVVADVAARGFVESKVNERAQQHKPPESRVSASVGGFPFVPKLLLGSEVSHIGVHMENVPAAAVIVFAEVDIDLDGVHIDRGRLINDRKARITAIDRGRVTATITERALRNALRGVPVEMSNGQLTLAGESVRPTTRNRQLVVGGLTVPATDYVPCVTDVEVQDGRLELSCEIEDIPPPLLDTFQDAIDR